MNDNEPAYYTIKEFSKKLRVHENTIRNAIKKGRLNAFRIGGGPKSSYRIPASEINRIALFDMKDFIEKIIEIKNLKLDNQNNFE